MNRLLVLSILGFGRIVSAQAILSEVMFNPAGNENAYEFIEIFNASATDSISLSGWKIGDQTETDLLVSPDSFYRLAPGRFAVVLDPGYFQTMAIYDSLIPADALILTIDDNSFGSGGLSNSTPEAVVLVDIAGRTAASYTYSLGNPDGISDEKVLLNTDDAPGNWANSRYLNGTPGQRNSVTPNQIDGEMLERSFTVAPANLREGEAATLSVTVRNAGLQTISTASVEFLIVDTNANLELPFRLGAAELPAALASADTVRLALAWDKAVAGRHELAINLSLTGDENHRNDTLRTSLAIGYPRAVLCLNEIMYSPPASQPEWIEIFNPQTTAVSITDWTIEDESGNRATIERKAVVPPMSYLVLAASPEVATLFDIADSFVIALDGFPTLNNSGDVLLWRDFSGIVIDSAAYQATWGAPGISAEKIWYERENLAENWRPSQDTRGGTPAALNSASPREIDLAAVRLQFDPAQPRAGDDVDLIAWIRNSGRRAVEQFAVTFAQDRNQDQTIQSGEEIGTVNVSVLLPAEDSIEVKHSWLLPLSGRHRILAAVSAPLDAVASNDRISTRLPVGYEVRSVMINEVYYSPRSGEAEWVELYNRSAQDVDLSAWRWRDADADTPIVFPDSALILASGEFALLAAERDIAHADPSVGVIAPRNWLTLNNDRERLVLADFHGGLQDSLSFSPSWGGDTGISLERINPNLTSNDSSNWSSCVDPNGNTAGKRNSIFTEVVPQQATITVSPQPFSPDGDGRDDFAIVQFQVPATTATAHVKIYDVRGRLVRQLLNNTPIGARHEVVWNGRDDADQLAPTGIYIVYLQAIQAAGGVLVEARTTLVLARKLD